MDPNLHMSPVRWVVTKVKMRHLCTFLRNCQILLSPEGILGHVFKRCKGLHVSSLLCFSLGLLWSAYLPCNAQLGVLPDLGGVPWSLVEEAVLLLSWV